MFKNMNSRQNVRKLSPVNQLVSCLPVACNAFFAAVPGNHTQLSGRNNLTIQMLTKTFSKKFKLLAVLNCGADRNNRKECGEF